MPSIPAKHSKKPLDYPLNTFGTRAAARARQASNKMTREERRHHFRRAMVLVYGSEREAEAALAVAPFRRARKPFAELP